MKGVEQKMDTSEIKNMPQKIEGKYGVYILDLEKEIGHGGNGRVFHVSIQKKIPGLPVSGLGYVIKVLTFSESKDDNEKEKRLARFIQEVKTVQSIRDQRLDVIPIYDSFMEQGEKAKYKWYLMPRANEYSYWGEISAIKKIKQMRELGNTLQKLHNKGIAHRDIKPDNLLFYKGRCCLTDFGLVWNVNDDLHISDKGEALGPIAIRPPEMEWGVDRLMNTPNYQKVDVYLFAKTLWIMLTRKKYGFRGIYKRSDPEIYFDNTELMMGDTLEPLHRLMEGATRHTNSDRINLSDCLDLLDQQIEIAEGNCRNSVLYSLRYDEAINEAKEQIASDITVFSDAVKIQQVMEKVKDSVNLVIDEYGEEYVIGTFKSVELIDGNIFKVEIQMAYNLGLKQRNKFIYMRILKVGIDVKNQCEFNIENLDGVPYVINRYSNLDELINSEEQEVGLDGRYIMYTKKIV